MIIVIIIISINGSVHGTYRGVMEIILELSSTIVSLAKCSSCEAVDHSPFGMRIPQRRNTGVLCV